MLGEGAKRPKARNLSGHGMDVNAAGISVKVGVHYPGRSVDLP
jgi:hypothetical protein